MSLGDITHVLWPWYLGCANLFSELKAQGPGSVYFFFRDWKHKAREEYAIPGLKPQGLGSAYYFRN